MFEWRIGGEHVLSSDGTFQEVLAPKDKGPLH